MPTPYAEHLDGRDPVDVLRSSIADFHALTSHLTPDRWATPYAPGKWTAQQVLVHLAQWEMIFGVRVRCGVGLPNYVVVPMDQDPLMGEAAVVDGPMAYGAFSGLRAMNLALAASLTRDQRKTIVQHPERGAIDVNDLLVTLAGHAVHHLNQLRELFPLRELLPTVS